MARIWLRYQISVTTVQTALIVIFLAIVHRRVTAVVKNFYCCCTVWEVPDAWVGCPQSKLQFGTLQHFCALQSFERQHSNHFLLTSEFIDYPFDFSINAWFMSLESIFSQTFNGSKVTGYYQSFEVFGVQLFQVEYGVSTDSRRLTYHVALFGQLSTHNMIQQLKCLVRGSKTLDVGIHTGQGN